MNTITMSHGAGGEAMRELIRDVFVAKFGNPQLREMSDSAIVDIPRAHLAFTTDSYVVKPIFFPGGDIGKLAICGTVNDLAVAGARPIYITAGFIIGEGFEIETLKKIASSMAEAAREARVAIVAGDTKVVDRASCDGIFINTSGIGELISKRPMMASRIAAGDAILINGPVACHGMAVMCAREGLSIKAEIESDCAPLCSLAEQLVAAIPDVRFMRDATRGGLGAVLTEACEGRNFGIEIDEAAIPIGEATRSACELLGIEPLYVANEGKLVAFVPADQANTALAAMHSHVHGRKAAIIGRTVTDGAGSVTLTTAIGTRRLVAPPSSEQLPRIC